MSATPLNVLVWDQEKMSARVRVRSDGRVSLPFLDDVNVAGMTPVALARSLEERLKQFIVTPQVTVVVEEAKPLSVSVLGQVGTARALQPRPGRQRRAGAGGGRRAEGLRAQGRIYLLRSGDGAVRIRMTYDDVTARNGSSLLAPAPIGRRRGRRVGRCEARSCSR